LKYQRIGGLAAFAQALAYLCFLALVLAILPAYGSYTLQDYTNPAELLRKAALHPSVQPFLLAYDLLTIAFGLLPLLVVVALGQRLEEATKSERQLMLGFVYINAALWLAAAAIDSAGLSTFLPLYVQHPDEAVAGYRVLGIVSLQLGNTGSFAYGLALLIQSWAAWRAKVFKRAFLVLSFVWGVIAVLSWPFVIAGAIGSLVGIVWCLWLSILLWRSIPPRAVSFAAKTNSEGVSILEGERRGKGNGC
jgi:hypothetical protein